MPKVSVLLTCYNHLKFLPAAWEGIWAQTERDFEIIAIDDGSTDGGREWLTERQDQARVIFNDSNLGTYGSLNRALEAAQGEFVAILNDDDVWAPTKLSQQVAMFERFPEMGLVHTNGWFIDGAGERIEGSPLGFEFPRTELGDVVLALLYQNKIIASAAMVRRDLLVRLGGFNEAYFGSGDWEMWLRVAEASLVGYLDDPLTYYRVHGGNASHKLERIWRDDEKLRLWIRDRYAAYNLRGYDPSALRAAKAHNEACLGTICTLNGSPSMGRKFYASSIRMAPLRFKSYARWLSTFVPKSAFRRTLRR